MRFFVLAMMLVSLASASLSEPSTTSIETGVMGNLKAQFIVAKSDRKQEPDRTWRYWIAMPNTSSSELRIELDQINFARPGGDQPLACNVKDCFGVFQTLRIAPDETLFVASNREVVSLALLAPDEEERGLPVITGLFADCTPVQSLLNAKFAKVLRSTRVAYVPFPASLDLGLDPICVK